MGLFVKELKVPYLSVCQLLFLVCGKILLVEHNFLISILMAIASTCHNITFPKATGCFPTQSWLTEDKQWERNESRCNECLKSSGGNWRDLECEQIPPEWWKSKAFYKWQNKSWHKIEIVLGRKHCEEKKKIVSNQHFLLFPQF